MLITLQKYKDLTGTTDSSQDSLLTSLIEVASNQISLFCDRIFEEDVYTEWLSHNCSRYYLPRQYPIVKVLYTGSLSKALTIENSGTNEYTIDISDEVLTIVGDNLDETTYDLNSVDYDTLTELASAIESDFADFQVTVDTTVNQTSITLQSKSYSLMAEDLLDINGLERSNSEVIIEDDMFKTSGVNCIIYKAGYSTIPADLQNTCALITQDMLSVNSGEQNKSITSFSITNYSESYGSDINFRDIVNNYADVLSAYKRTNF